MVSQGEANKTKRVAVRGNKGTYFKAATRKPWVAPKLQSYRASPEVLRSLGFDVGSGRLHGDAPSGGRHNATQQ